MNKKKGQRPMEERKTTFFADIQSEIDKKMEMGLEMNWRK